MDDFHERGVELLNQPDDDVTRGFRMTISKRDLRRAARLFREWAAIRSNSYADSDGAAWYGDPEMGYTADMARAEHDELLELARKLDAHAKALKA